MKNKMNFIRVAALAAVLGLSGVAQAQMPPTTGCHARFMAQANPATLDVNFSAGPNFPGVAYAWDFGDGSTGNQGTATHTYAAAGMYNVCLTITLSDSLGNVLCTDQHCDSVRAGAMPPPPPPVAHCNAHYGVHRSMHSDTLQFSGGGNAQGTTYAWDFGDGSTASGNPADHLYASPGTYYACLTVTSTDPNGAVLCTATWCDSIRIAGPPPPPPVVCDAHYMVHRGMHSDTLHFEGGRNAAGSTYAWDFGDGSTGSGNPADHLYANPGTYYTCLTVTSTDPSGAVLCTATWCDSIRVGTNPPPPPPPAAGCHAAFRWIRFMNSDTLHFGSRPNGPHATYAWDFGDGSTGNGQITDHAYAQPGTYYVCMTVTTTDSTGAVTCTDTWCDSVNTSGHFGGPPHPHHPHHFSNLSTDNSTDMQLQSERLAGTEVTADLAPMTATIYPNPVNVNSVIHIENAAGRVILRIYGSDGRLVDEKEFFSASDYTIADKSLSRGIYYYQAIDENSSVKGKFIIR